MTTSSTTSEASRPHRSPWRTAQLLALLALAFGVLLAGLSGWFLGAVAIAGLSAAALTFNFHVPGALVRLFAIGRTVAKYGERLVGHDAALRDQMRRRGDLFARMAAAPAVRSAGWQLGDQDRLADYLDDVEDLDNGRLRVDMPALALGTGLAFCLVATLVLVPLAALPIAAMGLGIAMLGRRTARLAAYRMEEIRRLRRAGGRIVGEAAASVVPLQAEGAWRGWIEAGLARFGQAEEERRVLRVAASRLDATLASFGPLSALAVMGAAALGGAQGEGLLVPAFLAFCWFALAEAGQGISRVVLAAERRRIASREIGRLLGPGSEITTSGAVPPAPPALRLSRFQRRAPGGRRSASTSRVHGSPIGRSCCWTSRPSISTRRRAGVSSGACWRGSATASSSSRPIATSGTPPRSCGFDLEQGGPMRDGRECSHGNRRIDR